MDGPSVFGSLLDRDAGWFRFGPADVTVPADRRYLPGTMVLETTWSSGEGWVIIHDCLVMGPWRHENPRARLAPRPPTDYDADHLLLRTVSCTNGSVQLIMDCEPVFDYGRRARPLELTPTEASTRSASRPDGDGPTLTLTSDIRIGVEGPSARARTLLREGDTRFCALSWGQLAAA